jgi:NTP pyrophosphatase (non-canonical NTP hydrolase)
MNETEYLLFVVAEECGEVAQRACKAARFGMFEVQPGQQEDNKRRIERELADLIATAELLGFKIRDEDKTAKVEKLRKFMAYSREIGILTGKPLYDPAFDPTLKKIDEGIQAIKDMSTNKPKRECQAKDMKPGHLYRLKDGEVVVFSRVGQTGKIIVHPPEDPDMQSSSALDPSYEVEEVVKNQKCTCDKSIPRLICAWCADQIAKGSPL